MATVGHIWYKQVPICRLINGFLLVCVHVLATLCWHHYLHAAFKNLPDKGTDTRKRTPDLLVIVPKLKENG